MSLICGSSSSIFSAIAFIEAILSFGSFLSFRRRLISSLAVFFWLRKSSTAATSWRYFWSRRRISGTSALAFLAARPLWTASMSSRMSLMSNIVVFYTIAAGKKQKTLTKKLLINIPSVADVQNIDSDLLPFDRVNDAVDTDSQGKLAFQFVF